MEDRSCREAHIIPTTSWNRQLAKTGIHANSPSLVSCSSTMSVCGAVASCLANGGRRELIKATHPSRNAKDRHARFQDGQLSLSSSWGPSMTLLRVLWSAAW